jgi:hypothetical protein
VEVRKTQIKIIYYTESVTLKESTTTDIGERNKIEKKRKVQKYA